MNVVNHCLTTGSGLACDSATALVGQSARTIGRSTTARAARALNVTSAGVPAAIRAVTA